MWAWSYLQAWKDQYSTPELSFWVPLQFFFSRLVINSRRPPFLYFSLLFPFSYSLFSGHYYSSSLIYSFYIPPYFLKLSFGFLYLAFNTVLSLTFVFHVRIPSSLKASCLTSSSHLFLEFSTLKFRENGLLRCEDLNIHAQPPNLEDQVSTLMSAGDSVIRLYTPVTGYPF